MSPVPGLLGAIGTSKAPSRPIPGYRTWHDASQIVGKSDGDRVTTFTDLSANGLSLGASGTVSRQPIYRASALNGLPGLQFTVVDFTEMEYGNNDYALAGDSTMFFVAAAIGAPASPGVSYLIDNPVPANRHTIYLQTVAGQGVCTSTIQPGSGGTLNVNMTAGEDLLIATKFAGASSLLRLNANGSRQSTGTLITALATLNPFRIAAQYNNLVTGNIDMKLCEIVTYPSALSSGDFALVELYLKTKYAF